MTKIRLDAGYRTVRLVLNRTVELGVALPRRITVGEVVTIGLGDVWVIARGLTVTGPGAGTLVGYGVVAVLLVRISPPLTAVVLAGAPVIAVVGPLLGSMQRAGDRYRGHAGELNGRLHDPVSGVTVESGVITAVAGAGAAAIVDRLGRYGTTDATWDGDRLDEIAKVAIRDRIRVADNDAHLSGGQRQRVRLARALYQDPEMLPAVEPTSAVDAHTEAAIAERLAAARRGWATLIATTSPVLLDRAEVVHYVRDGRVVASGTHRALMTDEPGYRALVSRRG